MKIPSITIRHPLLTIALSIILLVGGSHLLIRSLLLQEHREDYGAWKVMLESLADTKANTIHVWLSDQFSIISQLAKNPSLILYSQQLMEENHGTEPERAELVYLRNLIITTAERHDFVPSQASASIQANLTLSADNGLALFDSKLRQIAATPGFSYPTDSLTSKAMEAMQSGQPALLDIILHNGRPVLGFITPFSGLRVKGDSPSAIGIVMGYKNLEKTIFPTLTARSTNTKEESFLIQRDGEVISFLSPLSDGTPALGRHTQNKGEQVVVYASAHPGAFNERPDHNGINVLFTSRTIMGTPWILIQQIEADAALTESKAHLQSIVFSITLSTLLVSALMVAAWWHGASVKQKTLTDKLQARTEQLEAKTTLLDAINNNIKDLIILVDPNGVCLFANASLARLVNAVPVDLIGKSLANIFGAAQAKILNDAISQTLGNEITTVMPITLDFLSPPRQFHAIITSINGPKGILLALHDITEVTMHQRRESLLFQQLVRVLMRAIDLHDPYSANHSAKTAALAMAMGRAMRLSAEEMVTIEIAANLCNLGKLSIPRDVLTKESALTQKERCLIRQESQYAAQMLNDLEFPGPLQQTIIQKHEYLDGSGHPFHLKGDDIIITARVVAVANAFIGMTSPRAYRDRLENQIALSKIMQDCDSKYDRKAVAALFQVIENESDWESARGSMLKSQE